MTQMFRILILSLMMTSFAKAATEAAGLVQPKASSQITEDRLAECYQSHPILKNLVLIPDAEFSDKTKVAERKKEIETALASNGLGLQACAVT